MNPGDLQILEILRMNDKLMLAVKLAIGALEKAGDQKTLEMIATIIGKTRGTK